MADQPDADWGRAMVESQLRPRGITDPRVLDAMARLPRHLFVSPVSGQGQDAYRDCALPIGQGQTISQPYMVAVMSQLLEVQPGMKILEVGTGSGYQTAVLLELGATVWSMERSSALARQSADRLAKLGWSGPRLHLVDGDGSLGYEPGSPYDRILVTAGAPHLPKAYTQQLKPGGRIVIPIGDRSEQQLTVIQEHDGQHERTQVLPCRFVPLVGIDAWRDVDDMLSRP